MNQFEELCKLASDENWCWKLFCTTCGHMHFRYAFAELAAGKSPANENWLVHGRSTRYSNSIGALPRSYTEKEKININNICSQADLALIASNCTFPDWLGYLGLILDHMYSSDNSYTKLSWIWASQLLELVSEGSSLHASLTEIAMGKGLLNIKHLEEIESDIMHNNAISHGRLAAARLR